MDIADKMLGQKVGLKRLIGTDDGVVLLRLKGADGPDEFERRTEVVRQDNRVHDRPQALSKSIGSCRYKVFCLAVCRHRNRSSLAALWCF